MSIQCFPPLARTDAKQLVLGSMPGKESLRQQQYYAHPRNAFWKIMGKLFQFDATAPYEERCCNLCDSQIAVWDVLAHCTRRSSLDADIVESSIVANDFKSFFEQHASITIIYFNGRKAECAYLKYVHSGLAASQQHITNIWLPSTSPSHASLSFDEKLKAWQRLSQF